jgi:hypothetical protein
LDRIDALAGHTRKRFAVLTGKVVSAERDEDLQDIVREAAAAAGADSAVMTLLLERTQMFRASVGLSADLELAGGTDRNVSMCQFVVRAEAPVVVEDLRERPDLPQQLAVTHNLHSYAGVPLRIGDVVVGALCVLSDEKRATSPEVIARLEALSLRAGARLDVLRGEDDRNLLQMATGPVFGELKNALSPVSVAGAALRLLAAEIAPLGRALRAGELGQTALPVLRDATLAIDDIQELADELQHSASRVGEMVGLLESVLQRENSARALNDVLQTAQRMAVHATRVVGGVIVHGETPALVMSGGRHAVGFCAAALTSLASMVTNRAGLSLDVDVLGAEVIVNVRGCFAPGAALDCARELQRIGGHDVVNPIADGVALRFAVA